MARLIYEVNLQLDPTLADDYLPWLRSHMQQMLGLDGFLSADLAQVLQPSTPDKQLQLCVRYQLRDESALQHYFDHHAQDMRAQGIARFGQQVQATRRVLHAVDGCGLRQTTHPASL